MFRNKKEDRWDGKFMVWNYPTLLNNNGKFCILENRISNVEGKTENFLGWKGKQNLKGDNRKFNTWR